MEATAEGDGKKPTAPRLPPSPEKTDEADAEDEQVERFYALVANIQAMRAMFKAGSSCGDYSVNGEVTQPKKRRQLAEHQPPWRPAFAMEDFLDTTALVDGPDRKRARNSVVKEDERQEGEAVDVKEEADAAQSSSKK